jgi:hypothetical protein
MFAIGDNELEEVVLTLVEGIFVVDKTVEFTWVVEDELKVIILA